MFWCLFPHKGYNLPKGKTEPVRGGSTMAVPEKVTVGEAQQYYDTADSIRIKPGWMQGEASPCPKSNPTSGAGRRWSRWC